MSNLYYLKHTLLNLESWFDGFTYCLFEFDGSDMPVNYHQMLILYEKMISEIIEHAKSLVKDIEEGEVNEK